MFDAILKVTNSSFQKGMTFCRSIYVKKVMKLLAFIFEQPSYPPYLIFNFPVLDGDVPRSTSYGVYISQLVRFVEYLPILLISTIAIYCQLRNFFNKIINIINFAFFFQNFIAHTRI